MEYRLYKQYQENYYHLKIPSLEGVKEEIERGHHEGFPGLPIFYYEIGTDSFYILSKSLTIRDCISIRGKQK